MPLVVSEGSASNHTKVTRGSTGATDGKWRSCLPRLSEQEFDSRTHRSRPDPRDLVVHILFLLDLVAGSFCFLGQLSTRLIQLSHQIDLLSCSIFLLRRSYQALLMMLASLTGTKWLTTLRGSASDVASAGVLAELPAIPRLPAQHRLRRLRPSLATRAENSLTGCGGHSLASRSLCAVATNRPVRRVHLNGEHCSLTPKESRVRIPRGCAGAARAIWELAQA